MVILQCAANAPMETTSAVTQETCSVPAAFSSNDMDFYMGSDPYEGPTSCAWHGSNNNINAFPKAKPPIPPKPILLIKVTSETKAHTKNAKSEIAATMRNPGDDPRDAWLYISSCLAERELFSTGGVSVDPEGENTEPSQSEKEMLEVFVEANLDKWSINPGDRKFILSDARCMLYQAKDMVLRVELAALNTKKTKSVKVKVSRPAIYRKIDTAVSGMSREICSLDLNTICNNLVKHLDFDDNAQAYLIEKITANTHMGKIASGNAVKESVKNMKAANQSTKNNNKDAVPIVNEWDDSEMADWGQDQLASVTNDNGDPEMYQYEGDVSVVRDGQRKMLTQDQYAAELNTYTKWVRQNQSGKVRGVFAPKQVVNHNYNRSDKNYPEVKEVKAAPFFAYDGRRVDQQGYDAPTKTYLELGNLEVPPVSKTPTDGEVFEAKRLIMEEVLGDYPYEGVTDREERMDRGLNNKEGSKPLPSMAHSVCMMIERAARDLIAGPTPVYTPTKPLPGTGAGGLTAAVTLAATGKKAAAEPFPHSEEEYAKVMGAHISQSSEFVFFDNMNTALDNGTFASAVSEGRVRVRLLGSSRMVEAEVRHTWIAAANNIKGTPEILRRMIMIELDAKLADPTTRGEFRHKDLLKWVEENRPQLVWAILTLIQNWIAMGMNPWEGKPKASFEAWSRVMGGILRDAKIRGFLENEGRLRSYGATAGDSGLEVFIQYLASEHESGTLFRAGGTAEIRGRKGELVSSIKDDLNRADDNKPLLLGGWGYNREDQHYNHARGITTKFRDAARRAYEVTMYEERPNDGEKMIEVPVKYAVSFKEKPDPQSPKQYYWELVKTEVK